MDYKRETKIFLTLHLSLSRMNITCLRFVSTVVENGIFSKSLSRAGDAENIRLIGRLRCAFVSRLFAKVNKSKTHLLLLPTNAALFSPPVHVVALTVNWRIAAH